MTEPNTNTPNEFDDLPPGRGLLARATGLSHRSKRQPSAPPPRLVAPRLQIIAGGLEIEIRIAPLSDANTEAAQ